MQLLYETTLHLSFFFFKGGGVGACLGVFSPSLGRILHVLTLYEFLILWFWFIWESVLNQSFHLNWSVFILRGIYGKHELHDCLWWIWKLSDADVFIGSCNKRLVMGCLTVSCFCFFQLLWLQMCTASQLSGILPEQWVLNKRLKGPPSGSVPAKLPLLVTGKWLSRFPGGLGDTELSHHSSIRRKWTNWGMTIAREDCNMFPWISSITCSIWSTFARHNLYAY